MKKKIRSISISEFIDEKLKEDSDYRGLTISANLSRILHKYFQSQPIKTGLRLSVNPKNE
tara:strand:- start:251 stop:430 length:180 start_codon:yes stop_codon:yes gene_type:complete